MDPPAVITRQYEDQCGCRTCCSYPNNVCAILPAQIIIAIAFVTSALGYTGCGLVKVPNTLENRVDAFTIESFYNGTIPVDKVNNNATFRSLGLFWWEDIQGNCYNEGSTDHVDAKTVQTYWDFVQDDFFQFVILGAVVGALGVFVLIWSICLQTCVAHKRRYRRILVALLLVLLPLLQSFMFLILTTEFCREKGCEISESGYYIIIAAVFYFLAGFLLCIGTQDFPGNPYKKSKTILPLMLQRFFGQRTESSSIATSDTANRQQGQGGAMDTNIEMANYNNGFADAVEIPVESEFLDRTLIESDAATTPQNDHNTAVDWTGLAHHSMEAMTGNINSTTIMSSEVVKSNV